MLEQIIRRADFHVENGELTPRFGLLMNDSQIKNLNTTLSNKIKADYDERRANDMGIPDAEILRQIKNNVEGKEFPTLLSMNKEGWRLESFASVIDVNQIRIQVAIFSREVE